MSSAISSIGDAVGSVFGGAKRALGIDGEAAYHNEMGGLVQGAMDMSKEAGADYAAQQGNRTDFGNALAQGALGKGPSLAQAQLQAAQDRNLAQQVAAAKANRAVNPALAARQSANLGAQMGQATAQQAAQARLMEQQQQQGAYQNYLNSLQNSRSAALGAGTGAASAAAANQAGHNQRQQQMWGNIMNTGAQVAGMVMSDKNVKTDIKKEGHKSKKMSDGGLVEDSMAGVAQAYANGGMVDVNPNAPGGPGFQYYEKMFMPEQTESKNSGASMDLVKKLMAGGGDKGTTVAGGPLDAGAMAMPTMVASKGAVVPGKAKVPGDSKQNDVVKAMLSPGELVVPRSAVAAGPDGVKAFAKEILQQKKNAESGGKPEGVETEDFSPKSFLDALQPYSYKYKGGVAELPTAGEGRYLSVMAQDLEKAGPVGKSMVEETANGKAVNYGKGFGAILAAQADLNQRLSDIEKRYGKKEK